VLIVPSWFFRLVVSFGLRFGLHRLGCLLQKTVEVAPFEQSVSVRWIPVHWNVTTGGPFAKRVLSDSDVLGCRCCVQVFS